MMAQPKAPDGLPDASEFGQLRAYLAKPDSIGNKLSQQQINDMIGTTPGGRTRDEITTLIKKGLKHLPAA